MKTVALMVHSKPQSEAILFLLNVPMLSPHKEQGKGLWLVRQQKGVKARIGAGLFITREQMLKATVVKTYSSGLL